MLPLTPERLSSVYDCLSHFPPFCTMALPAPCDVRFQVLRTNKDDGDYNRYRGTDDHFLRVSSTRHAHFASLAATVGHEMIHMHLARTRIETRGYHNEEFKRIAKRACRMMGWDYGQFI